jgi:hypothetical protein
MGELPSERGTEVLIKGSDEYNAELKKIQDEIAKVPESKTTIVKADADAESAKDAVNTLFITVTSETGDIFNIPVKVRPDDKSVEDTKKKIDEIPKEKLMIAKVENRTEFEITKIKAQAELLEAAFEWEAKINIVEIEEHMTTIRTLSDNLTTAFSSTGDVISSMVSGLGDLSGFEAFKVLSFIESESARREKLLDAQLKLTEAELKWLEAKTASVEKGEAAISVMMEGVYPELELIMWKIIERVQIEATREGLDLII